MSNVETKMTWRALAVLMSVALIPVNATAAEPPARRPLIATQQNHSLVDAQDCQSFHTRTMTTLPHTVNAEERKNLQLGGTKHLRVQAGNEGGVSVLGWDRPYARLAVCKSAAALTEAQAQRALETVHVAASGSEIVAHGPAFDETQIWWVNIILWVPRAARLDIVATNGGIAIRNMDGRVTAKATNGGISIASCRGEHHLETHNGGISIDKVQGSVNAVTQSGPISLKLRELPLPAIEAVTAEQGSIHCSVKGCSDGVGQWGENRKRLRIAGETAPSIRLMSFSADIMIEQVR